MESVPVGEEGTARNEQDIEATVALDGDRACIGRARRLAADFLTRVRAEHGLPVSQRARELTQLVVSELVTNACKYAAGDTVEVAVWDGDPVLPVARAADTGRVGQHGLEIVMAVCRSFQVHREPVGKRIMATVVLADDSSGAVADRRAV
ncbi:ATP-binding protein [Streptomyces flaveolus]|uniref:ATP-binding protein n=1 Tax=Streptomyces flaveolus TaxID=67297 RepID=UPI0036F5EB62